MAHAYEDAFRARGLVAAQMLLTLGDTEERRRYLNARNTISTLLELGAVPVVNENDTVATSEIRYGDNDRLAARVASMMSADCLVLLSDIDGFYTAPPGSGADCRRLDVVREITPAIEAMAGDAGSELSRGGMVTKIEAAKIAVAGGANMVIASGKVAQSAAGACGGGALHLVPRPCRRRSLRANAGSPDRWSRAGSSPSIAGPRAALPQRQEPAAGGRDQGRRRVRARRRGGDPEWRGRRNRTRACRL